MDFQKEVIDQSKKYPVLVDFWAEWCGPCKFLGPILEELEKEQDRWKLVKIDVDKHPEISQRFSIRGIPDVRLFNDGQEVGQFTGAKPKHEIQKWLIEHIPDERIEILNLILAELPQNSERLEKFVQDNPDLKIGQIALAKHLVWSNAKKAAELIGKIPPGQDFYDEAAAIQQIHEFMQKAFGGLPVGLPLKIAQNEIQQQHHEAAVEAVVNAVLVDKTFDNDLPRKLAIALFTLLGPTHEVTKKYRRKFDMALY